MTTTGSGWATVRQLLESMAKFIGALTVLISTLAPVIDPARQYLASHTEPQVVIVDYAPFGNHKLISLPDGSTVDLNTDSHLSAVISGNERSVHLESGEAVFQVASDRDRPFTVKVGHVQIRVLGTRFDVYGETSPYTGERGTRIVVLDGAIQVTRDDTSAQFIIRLAAGDEIEIPDDRTKTAHLRHLTERAAAWLTAWQHGAIEFEGRTLQEILTDYARYRPVQFDSKDPAILSQPFTGVFFTSDVSPFLKSLEAQCIRTSYKDGGRHIVLSRVPGKHEGDTCP